MKMLQSGSTFPVLWIQSRAYCAAPSSPTILMAVVLTSSTAMSKTPRLSSTSSAFARIQRRVNFSFWSTLTELRATACKTHTMLM